jgi:exodeoxyribonuclease VII small subunit
MAEEKKIKFEKGLEDLEKIVRAMESGDLSLEDVLKYYEGGIQLSRVLQKKLDEATRKIETLTKSQTGELEAKTLEVEKQSKPSVKKTSTSKEDVKDMLI